MKYARVYINYERLTRMMTSYQVPSQNAGA